MRRRVFAAALATTALLTLSATGPVSAAPAPRASSATPAKAKACFSVSRIANWTRVDDNIVYLRVEGGAYFQIVLAGQCLKPATSRNAALTFETRVSDDVCQPLDLTVVAATGIAPLRCGVQSLHRLSPEEVAALPSKQKP
jgi:hypothetical protein